MTRTINCRYCQGLRQVNERGICMGCGSQAADAVLRSRTWRKHCPKCTDGVMEIGRVDSVYRCETCGHSER